MKVMYDKYYLESPSGFTIEDFYSEIDILVGKDLSSRLRPIIETTKKIDWTPLLEGNGLILDSSLSQNVQRPFGLSLRSDPQKVWIYAIENGSPAWDMGISPGDLVLALNDIPVTPTNYRETFNHAPGDTITLLLNRDGKIIERSFEPQPYFSTKYFFKEKRDIKGKTRKLYSIFKSRKGIVNK